MHVLIVHAHHEPASFSSALKDRAVVTLSRLGHTVDVADLYAMGLDPVSDRRNFHTVLDASYLKQQREESHAADLGGFVPELAAEMERLLRADLVIFNFPLWWFGMPAILKGWVDRVVAYGAMYENGRIYENGFGRGKRALVTTTTGSPAASFDGFGYNPPMASVLAPINHGIFWFNGFAPLPPFVAYAVARMDDGERARELDRYASYLASLDDLRPTTLPRLEDFDASTKRDRLGRWMLEMRGAVLDEARIASLQDEGVILATWRVSDAEASDARWFVVRSAERRDVAAIAAALHATENEAHIAIHELARPGQLVRAG